MATRGSAAVDRFVVAGGSLAGMAAALALARIGADVVLVERDVVPLAADPEAAFCLERPGVPQSHFLHAFLARMVQEMQSRFPEVLDDLLGAGGRLARPPVDELADVTMLLARRSTVEWVFRRAVLAEPGITVLTGRTVVGSRVPVRRSPPPASTMGAGCPARSSPAPAGAPMSVRGSSRSAWRSPSDWWKASWCTSPAGTGPPISPPSGSSC